MTTSMSPLTLPLRVVFVTPTLSKVHTTPTIQLETDAQAEKLPAFYHRNGEKITQERSPKNTKNL
jgi:hypothetical protein